MTWYRRHRRDLPWRRTRDPYAIWISEVMLQQTQVATVIPYYERFLARFPNSHALAAAPEAEILRMWEGLGYYRRARALHRSAQLMVAEHGGQIPRTMEQLSNLPGIGRYTAGAILSQAFDLPVPIVEANSARVLSRWFTPNEGHKAAKQRDRLWALAASVVPRVQPGEFNQALMELGALVCTPREPSCDACPIAVHCRARSLGIQNETPASERRPQTVHVKEAAVIIWKGSRLLLLQRPEDAARWPTLWEFPHGPVVDGEADDVAARRLANELTNLQIELAGEPITLRHSITRYIITMKCYRAYHRGGRYRSRYYAKGCWIKPVALSEFPLSAPQRRLAGRLVSGI